MFRDCYFEYAGISSQPYGLIMCYVGNSNEDFDSGGKFELKTDTLPRSHETLLYGKDYSAEPLNFDVEIVSHDDYIPLEQMTEIKNWLFGQDGWKTLKLADERQNYHLKCIFQPGEDIVDGLGYRGVRCTLVNVSPFWYGDEREITIYNNTPAGGNTLTEHCNSNAVSWNIFEVNVPEESAVDCDILPTIIIDAKSAPPPFYLVNTSATTFEDAMEYADSQFVFQPTSAIRYSTSYLNDHFSEGTADVVTVNSRYMTIVSGKYPAEFISPLIDTSNPLPILRLHKGVNMLRINGGNAYNSITFRYTPVYRLGAF